MISLIPRPSTSVVDQAVGIHMRSFVGPERAPTGIFLHRCQNDMFFADIENDVVRGYAVVENRRPLWWLWEMAVDPDHRGKHIASGLLGEVEKMARVSGEHGIELTVRTDNEKAFILYSRNGYQTIRRLRNYYVGADGFLMRRDL